MTDVVIAEFLTLLGLVCRRWGGRGQGRGQVLQCHIVGDALAAGSTAITGSSGGQVMHSPGGASQDLTPPIAGLAPCAKWGVRETFPASGEEIGVASQPAQPRERGAHC